MAQLAQLNIARARFTRDDPEMRDFVSGLNPVNDLAYDPPGSGTFGFSASFDPPADL